MVNSIAVQSKKARVAKVLDIDHLLSANVLTDAINSNPRAKHEPASKPKPARFFPPRIIRVVWL